MGTRSYLNEIKISQTENDFKINIVNEICLGKLLAYLDYKEIPESETFAIIKKIDKDEEDNEYFEQYEDIGFCNEYITLNTIITGETAFKIILAFESDKRKFECWPYSRECFEELIGSINMNGFYLFEMHGA